MVLTLVAILTTVGIGKFIDFSKDAKTSVTRDRLVAIKQAIIGDARLVSQGQYTKPGYEVQCQTLPTSLNDLIAMPAAGTCAAAYDPFTKRGWRGPYLSTTEPTWDKDGWGTALQYFNAGPPARTLRSCGPDLICGNADDITVNF